MRVLVTGGAGFIGAALARRLLHDGHDVAIVDNLSTGRRENLPAGARFIEADIAEPAALTVLAPGPFDAVAHLAAQSSGAIGQADPYADMRVNVGATLLLAQWCRKQGVRRFVFTSSMTVYGQTNREPVDETSPTIPISYYGAAKVAAETYLRLAAAEGLSVTSFRLYNVYGRGQNLSNLYQGMTSIYLAYLLRRVPVPVTGRLDRYRDFVHVDDVVNVLSAALVRPATPSIVYNIGTGRKTTVRQILDLLLEELGLPPDYPIDEQSGSPSDVFGSVADVRRARADLGWAPRVSVKDGIADMVMWAKSLS